MKALANLVTTILFLAMVALAPGLVRGALADQRAKADLAEVNHIMYGILSVNAWKGQITSIIYSEIAKLDLKKATTKLRSTIENQLAGVIDKLNERIRDANQSSFGGRVKQTLIDLVVDIEEVKKGVPGYAETLITEFTKPETQKAVKELATEQLKAYFRKTFTEQDMAPVEAVLKRTGTKNVGDADKKLKSEIESRKNGLMIRGYAMIGLAIILFVWVAIPHNRSRFGVTMLFATLVVLLIVGISIPMIDLEAKIAEVSFYLFGHKVGFENQILYFQSKSVLDVFFLMITHADLKMKFVGVLLVVFSVVFPVLKLAASMIYYYFERTRRSRIVKFFAFKTGKWSMADVMVIAILMAYIGFNGIVETQFERMEALVPNDMTFITTNGTTLQMGFYIFLVYAILSLALTGYLKPSQEQRV